MSAALPPGFVLDTAPSAPPPGFEPDVAQTGGVADIPVDRSVRAPAPTAPPAPAPKEYGLMQKLRAGLEAARNTVETVLPGAVGMAGGFLGGVAGSIATGDFGTPQGVSNVERATAEGAQRLIERGQRNGALRAPQTELGQQYAQEVGEAAQKYLPALTATPAGTLGMGAKGPGPATPRGTPARVVAKAAGERAVDAIDAAAGVPAEQRAAARAGADRAAAAERQQVVIAKLPTETAIKESREAGYKVSPTAGRRGAAARTLESVGGEKELKQKLSGENQQTTNKLVRQDIGLPDDAPATADELNKIRRAEGEKYAAVADIGEFQHDAKFQADLKNVFQDAEKANESYPGLSTAEETAQRNISALDVPTATTESTVAAVRRLRDLADSEYRQGRTDTGRAYRRAAQALDDSMDRALSGMAEETKDPALASRISEYQAARQRIAKVYTALKALDEHGNFDAKAYGRELDKGRPLSGPGLRVAQFYNRFGEQGLAQRPKGAASTSPADVALGAVRSLAGKGTTRAALEVGMARPGVRAALSAMEGRAVKKAQRAVPAGEAAQVGENARANAAEVLGPAVETAPGAGPTLDAPGPRAGRVLQAPVEEFPLQLAPEGAASVEGVDAQGLHPATGDDMPPARVNPAPRPQRAEQIPAVPGRPDLPEVMVAGEPREVAADTPTGAAMQTPNAALAREQQNPGNQVVRDAKAANAASDVELAHRLRIAAAQTSDEAMAAALRKRADRLDPPNQTPTAEAREVSMSEAGPKAEKTGKVPAGKATEILMSEAGPAAAKTPQKIPAGRAEEVPVERVEPAPEPIETPETEVQYLDDAEWRKLFGLGGADAERAVATRRALDLDPKAVEEAAAKFDQQPAKFDAAVQDIVAKGKPDPREAWIAEHKLTSSDARRAERVAKALEVDEAAVHAAAERYENNPTKFDTVIDHILNGGQP